MRNATSRGTVFWLLFADVLLRLWMAGGSFEATPVWGLVLHFAIGTRIGTLLFLRIRPRDFVTSAPLLFYWPVLLLSSLGLDHFSLILQWILIFVLVHVPDRREIQK